MRKAIIHKMSSGHWVATFNTDGVVTGTRVVGDPGTKAQTAANHVQANFPVDLVGIRAKDIGQACVATFGPTIWLR